MIFNKLHCKVKQKHPLRAVLENNSKVAGCNYSKNELLHRCFNQGFLIQVKNRYFLKHLSGDAKPYTHEQNFTIIFFFVVS